MHRATIKVLLVLSLVIGGTLGASSIALASDHDHLREYQVVTKHHFPWVPAGDAIGEMEPWSGSISVQNMESDPVQIFIMPDGRFDPDEALAQFPLYSYESDSIPVEELGIEGDGSSLVVMAVYDEIWNQRDSENGLAALEVFGEMRTPEVVASLKQAAGAPMENGVWTGEAQQSIDGYAAIPSNDVGWGTHALNCPSDYAIDCANIEDLDEAGIDGTSYLPLAQTNSDWNTTLYVSNVDGALDTGSSVEVELIPGSESDNDSTWSEVTSLEPGETWEIDVLDAVGADWTGSVQISSDAGTAAIAARHKASNNMMLINTSTASRTDSGNGYQVNAPLIFRDWGGWHTGISIANQSNELNSIAVRFFDEEGEQVGVETMTVEGGGHNFIYIPSEVDPGDEGWYGTAIVESQNGQPFHAAVDQVNYQSGAGMTYTLGGETATDRFEDNLLGLPLFQKSGDDGNGDTSGIQLFNPDPENSVELVLRINESDESDVDLPGSGETTRIELEPRASHTFYAPEVDDLPDNTVASVTVEVMGGAGQVSAVSNLVNYDVDGDGGMVINLSNGAGLSR